MGFETQQEVKNLACRKSTGESSPGGLGPGRPGLGARPTRGLGLFLSNYDFFANLLAEGVGVG